MVKETVDKVQVLENGQPVNLLPKGVNTFGLPVDQAGPIVLGNEPERSLRAGPQYRLEHDEKTGISQMIDLLDESILISPALNARKVSKDLEEGVKDGYNHYWRTDTGDQDWITKKPFVTNPNITGTYPIELSNEFPTITDPQIHYEPTYYNKQNLQNQPHRQVCPHCGMDFVPAQLLNHPDIMEAYNEEDHPRNPDGTWKQKGSADKPLDVSPSSLNVEPKVLLRPEPKLKPSFKPEKIVKTEQPVQAHIKSAQFVRMKYPNSRLPEKFLIHQAWASDLLRSAHEPVVHAREAKLKEAFPDAEVSGRVKNRTSMVEKLARKPDKYHAVSELTDISALRVACPKGINQMNQVLDYIKQTSDVTEVEDYVNNPNDGYRSIHLLSRDRDSGLISEIQIRTPNQDKWAVWAHEAILKPPPKLAPIVIKNKDIIKKYALEMSDYFYKVDTGQTNVQKPACPEVIRKLECL